MQCIHPMPTFLIVNIFGGFLKLTTEQFTCLNATGMIPSTLILRYALSNYTSYDTLTNDSHILAMMTVELPHTTPVALCQVRFSPYTLDVLKNWSTPITKVGITD